MMKKGFSENIHLLRNKMNLNQYEFAALIGIKQPTLSTYERNASSPSLEVLISIAEKCNVSLDWLCGIESTPGFYTVADVILKLKAIGDLYDIEYNIDSKMNDTVEYLYECDIHLKSKQDTPDDNCLKHISEFIHNWKTIKEQATNIPDKDTRNNYIQMWWEKQITHYSTIPVKRKGEVKQKYADEITDA